MACSFQQINLPTFQFKIVKILISCFLFLANERMNFETIITISQLISEMFVKSLIFACLATTVLSKSSSSSSLQLSLFDKFGDGWNGALLWLEKPNGDTNSATVECGDFGLDIDIEPDDTNADGLYQLYVSKNGLMAEPWEVLKCYKIVIYCPHNQILFYRFCGPFVLLTLRMITLVALIRVWSGSMTALTRRKESGL